MGEITVRRVLLPVPYLLLATSRPACWRTAAQTGWMQPGKAGRLRLDRHQPRLRPVHGKIRFAWKVPLSETAQAVQIYRQLQYRFGLDMILFTPPRLAQRLA
jgi:hypothetical protein